MTLDEGGRKCRIVRVAEKLSQNVENKDHVMQQQLVALKQS